jgi:hypothetical protein
MPTAHLPHLLVRDTGTIKGRGVYALRSHAEGEIVESCPVILLTATFTEIPIEVRRVLFNWGVLANTRPSHCLALGYGSLYNHGNPANMRYEGDDEAKVLRFVAIRAIAAGEELTVNYSSEGGGHESAENDWFARMGETRHPDW